MVSVVVCAAWRGVKPLLATLCAYNKGTVQHDSKSFTLKYLTPKVDEYIDFNVLITNIALFERIISLIIYAKIKTDFASRSMRYTTAICWLAAIQNFVNEFGKNIQKTNFDHVKWGIYLSHEWCYVTQAWLLLFQRDGLAVSSKLVMCIVWSKTDQTRATAN